jgi:hypothetical protein
MALVQYGSFVTNIKGKVGGHYFKGSLGGAVVQSTGLTGRTSHTYNPSSSRGITQSGQHVSAVLLIVVRSWKNVTAVNRAAWQAAAPNFPTVNKFGVPVKPSGYHCYVHINFARVSNNLTLLSTPPAVVAGTLPPVFTITTATSSSLSITLGAAVPTGFQLTVCATTSISAGIKPSHNLFRAFNWAAAGTSGVINCTLPYEYYNGAPVTGNTIWIGCFLSSTTTGQKTQLYIVGQVVS